MQMGLDEPWYEDDDPDTVAMYVGIEGVGVLEHEIPEKFLEQEFSDREAQREFILEQLEELAFNASISWRERNE